MGTVTIPMRVGNDWRQAENHRTHLDPYHGDAVARVPDNAPDEVAAAVSAARAALDRVPPAHERADYLRRVAGLVRRDADKIARAMTRETGKPITDSTTEVARSAKTLEIAAEEAVRIEGQYVPIDATPMGAGKLALLQRHPVGVVAAITPFNAPVNLACHKLGPAIAAGNAVVLKASPAASLCIHMLVELFVEAGLEPGVINTVYGDAAGAYLVGDPGVDFISFTGSSAVARKISAVSGLRRMTLELGGNGWTIVDQGSDTRTITSLCAMNSMRLAGQSCISVQNVAVHRSLFNGFAESVAARAAGMSVGDPHLKETQIGTLIDEAAAIRVEGMAARAIDAGAKPLLTGTRTGAQLTPTVLVGPSPDAEIVMNEIFGPVVSILPFDDISDVFEWVNASGYGLQTGLFTPSIDTMMKASRTLRTGGLIVNGSSTWRTDDLPYGGVGESGMGREGPKYAIREMTEERLMVFNL